MNLAYKNIFKATTLFGGVQGLTIIMGLIRTKFVALLIGPAGVGLNSIYNETRELVHETTNCGMDQSGIRDISKSYEKLINAKTKDEIDFCKATLKRQISLLRSWELLLGMLGIFITILLAQPLSLMTFQDTEHTWGYVLLSPAVALSTITCGELVVLKAIRRLKTVALLSTLNIFLALFIILPIYYYWRLHGVLPAILSTCFVSALTTVYASYRYSQPIFNWSWKELKHGIPMLRLGACFVLTGMMAHGMELLIMSHINNLSNEIIVGLYRAGYTITGTYAALLFNAVSTDFFPRLSGVVDDIKKRNTAVCQQMEVLLMLVGPMTVALLVAMPILVPFLYSDSFIEMIPMARISVFGVLLGAIYLPAAYLPLAAGDSKLFVLVETISTITMTMILVGFTYEGLFGAGVGKVISALIDVIAVMALSIFYYKIRISRSHLLLIISHLIILIATYALTSVLNGWKYWVTSVIILAMSLFASWKFYKTRTDSMQQ